MAEDDSSTEELPGLVGAPAFSTILTSSEKQNDLKFAGPIEALTRLKRDAVDANMSPDTIDEFDKVLTQTRRLRRKYVQEASSKPAFTWTSVDKLHACANLCRAETHLQSVLQALPMSRDAAPDAKPAASVAGPASGLKGLDLSIPRW